MKYMEIFIWGNKKVLSTNNILYSYSLIIYNKELIKISRKKNPYSTIQEFYTWPKIKRKQTKRNFKD